MHNECHVNSLVPQHSSQYIYRNYILWSIPTTYLYLVQISVGFEDLKNNLLCVLHFEIATLHTYLFSLCFQFSTKIYILTYYILLQYTLVSWAYIINKMLLRDNSNSTRILAGLHPSNTDYITKMMNTHIHTS